jgi:hypothetical protein
MSITFTAAILRDDVLDLTDRPGVPSLNVNSSNAAELLSLLGLDVEPDGDVAAEDLLGRVLLAQALLDVATDDEHGRLPATEANWTTCGRRPGYLADRLAVLHTIATWARRHDAIVAWA